jgi:Transposase DDE domain
MCARLSAVLRQLCDSRAEKAGYTRFFNNAKVSVEEIVSAAAALTRQAAAGRHALIIEDTSEINYASKASRKQGLGRVGNGSDPGLFVHPALAVDADDASLLGLADARIWCRHAAKQPEYQSQPIETKESHRWIETAVKARAALVNTLLATVVADREADIYEVFARVPDERTHVLIRSHHDRALASGGRLHTALAARPEAGRLSFRLPARPGRSGRDVVLAVRFGSFALRQPRRGADKRDPRALRLNVVDVREIDPPAGEEAVHWRLLTSHAVNDVAGAARMVDHYRLRWTVEQTFRTLKSKALDIEASFIADAAALQRLAAAALVAATRVMQLVHARGEAGQRLPASRLFGPDEVAVLHALTPTLQGKTQKQRNPHRPDSLAWAAWHVARLGGWTGYATERPPGPITFSRGLTRFAAIAQGFNLPNHCKPSRNHDVCSP